MRSLLLVLACALPGLAAAGDSGLPKDFKLPSSASVAVYLPKHVRELRVPVPSMGVWDSGRTLQEIVLATAERYFSATRALDEQNDRAYGLLIALHPRPKVENDQLIYEMSFEVFGPDAHSLLKGIRTAAAPLNQFTGPQVFDKVAQQAVNAVMVEVISSLRPDKDKFPAGAAGEPGSLAFAISRDKPWATGTGFYFNASGQVMTAAHVVNDCIVVELVADGKTRPGKVLAKNHLLDIAVLDTGEPAAKFLPLRRGLTFELGEPVVIVGYPLGDMMMDTPTLTRGNVSSKAGLSGSVGQFQFSAPIQPGSSGGPVVSDQGELLGMAVGTLNAAALVRSGAIPQNVNFALDARYAAQFLGKQNYSFTLAEPGQKSEARSANEAALAAVTSVRCYQ